MGLRLEQKKTGKHRDQGLRVLPGWSWVIDYPIKLPKLVRDIRGLTRSRVGLDSGIGFHFSLRKGEGFFFTLNGVSALGRANLNLHVFFASRNRKRLGGTGRDFLNRVTDFIEVGRARLVGDADFLCGVGCRSGSQHHRGD
jgi:hypothetical protein